MTEKEKKPASEIEDPMEALQRRIEVQLEEWSASIDRLRAEAERKEFDEHLRREYFERAQALRDRLSETAEQVQELAKSGGKKWKDLKRGLDEAWHDLKSALEDDSRKD